MRLFFTLHEDRKSYIGCLKHPMLKDYHIVWKKLHLRGNTDWVVVAHAFNPSILEADVCEFKARLVY